MFGKIIDDAFLRNTSQELDSGSFQNVLSLELILRGLAKRLDDHVPFLERPPLTDLQNSITKLPQNFFNNLHAVVKFSDLQAHQKEDTKDVIEAVQKRMPGLLMRFLFKSELRSRRISLKDVENLQNPFVIDYLKPVGLEESALRHSSTDRGT